MGSGFHRRDESSARSNAGASLLTYRFPLVVEEAGGTVTDIHGQQPEFHHGSTLANNEGMVVTNGKFHELVITSVGEAAPS